MRCSREMQKGESGRETDVHRKGHKKRERKRKRQWETLL
jgi:hypothetical protein